MMKKSKNFPLQGSILPFEFLDEKDLSEGFLDARIVCEKCYFLSNRVSLE